MGHRELLPGWLSVKETGGGAHAHRPCGPVRRTVAAAARHADLAVHRASVRQARHLPPGRWPVRPAWNVQPLRPAGLWGEHYGERHRPRAVADAGTTSALNGLRSSWA